MVRQARIMIRWWFKGTWWTIIKLNIVYFIKKGPTNKRQYAWIFPSTMVQWPTIEYWLLWLIPATTIGFRVQNNINTILTHGTTTLVDAHTIPVGNDIPSREVQIVKIEPHTCTQGLEPLNLLIASKAYLIVHMVRSLRNRAGNNRCHWRREAERLRYQLIRLTY